MLERSVVRKISVNGGGGGGGGDGCKEKVSIPDINCD